MNSTTFDDGRVDRTFHKSFALALEKASLDLAKPNVISTEQRPVDVYAPCPCGSGKKLKFCCLKR